MGDWTKIQKRFDALEARVAFLEKENAQEKAEQLAANRPRARGKAPIKIDEELRS